MQTGQKLGIRVFYYFLYKKVLFALILFVITALFFSVKSTIISGLSSILPSSLSMGIVSFLGIGLLIISIFVLIVGVIMSWLSYISCTFILGDNAFIIRRGILSKKEVSIPYRQVQDVTIEQSFSHRMMGVSKLIVLTAGNDDVDKEGESEGIFNIIDSTVAVKMREFLLQKISVQTVQEVKSPAMN